MEENRGKLFICSPNFVIAHSENNERIPVLEKFLVTPEFIFETRKGSLGAINYVRFSIR